ncbi:hypothetical protein [Janthinobacterium agaricidamnosum]|uniref:Uncharacterized protein n=1 Tax=Janthinobacterium agaricidamnosum NBRC 102515 = DSM 9628 TaxID=1349767 RepID=W0VE48_9BURK|nr:hypothetical protein [Janthinobacterium agaricidamnosum]CDG85940.1 putative uncharacterized protein [Janthinobacterium agaricidamnosum NBRC 102515 = DSM 9628]
MSIAPINPVSGAAAPAGAGKKTDGKSFDAVLQEAVNGPKVPKKSAADELEAYVKMTPAQRMRADILNRLGLTEEQVAQMSPQDQEALEGKIAELTKQQIELQQQQSAARPARINISV